MDWHWPKQTKGSEDDDDDGDHTSHTLMDSDEDLEDEPQCKKERSCKLWGSTEEAQSSTPFPPLEIVVLDPSTGNFKELFKMSLGSEE